jgi:ribosomal protein L11 methyltransferase
MIDSDFLPVSLWNVEFKVTTSMIPSYVFLLEEMDAAVAWEEDPHHGLHKVTGTFSFREEPLPTVESLTHEIHQRCKDLELPIPGLRIEQLPEKNWLAENRASFPPLMVGKFFVYGSHYKDPIPKDKFPLRIDAAMAFGSGEHATTKGCLEAISHLAKFADPKACLDMGCGSGILALAMAKIWPSVSITACDNDPFAVNTTRDNAVLNDVTVKSILSDGYQSLDKSQKFDVITANILAQPLCDMAADAAKALNPGGYMILSGFYGHQLPQIIEHHKAQNLKIYLVLTIPNAPKPVAFHGPEALEKDQVFTSNDWATMIVQAGE